MGASWRLLTSDKVVSEKLFVSKVFSVRVRIVVSIQPELSIVFQVQKSNVKQPDCTENYHIAKTVCLTRLWLLIVFSWFPVSKNTICVGEFGRWGSQRFSVTFCVPNLNTFVAKENQRSESQYCTFRLFKVLNSKYRPILIRSWENALFSNFG